jgi:hypothetical protein
MGELARSARDATPSRTPLMRLYLIPFALTAAAGLSAQSQVTSPLGFDAIEGSTSFNHFTDSGDRRFQQIDHSFAGTSFLTRSLGFRRNGTGSGGGTNEPPRTMQLEITFGLTDMTVLSSEFDANFQAGTRQVCFTRKLVNMPDWTGLAGSPAPFDFNVPLDVPYPYAGSDALVIDFTYDSLRWSTGSASGGSAVDREYTGARTATGSAIGNGCTPSTASGAFSHSMRLENNGAGGGAYGMRLRISASNAPQNTPIIMNLDLMDQNLTVPGLCTTLHALPALSAPIGLADPSGDLLQTSISFGYDASFVGVQLVTQLAGFDPGQPQVPLVLSEGRRASMPAGPTTTSHPTAYHWATLPTPDGTLFFGGGMVLQLGL